MVKVESDFIWRRFSIPFSEWTIVVPVLFALAVLFVIACLRQGKGIGTLLFGLTMLIFVPLIVAYDHTTHGPPPAPDLYFGWLTWLAGWPSRNPYVFQMLMKIGLVGLIVGGFAVNLLREMSVPAVFAWIGGVLFLPVNLAWVIFAQLLAARMREAGIKETAPFEVAPYILLFLIQCLVTSIKARVWIGLIVIAFLSIIYLPFAYFLQPYASWLVVLVPLSFIALFYVVMMYVNDAKTIHPAWCVFLGFLRCLVYAILTYVFLLPGRQFFETSEIYPKVLILVDVSGSMRNKDEQRRSGQEDTRLSRMEKVIVFMNSSKGPDGNDRSPWINRLLEKSPSTLYRFGKKLDEKTLHKLVDGMKEENGKQVPGNPFALTADDLSKLQTQKERDDELLKRWKKFLEPALEDIELTEEEKKTAFPTQKEQDEEKVRRERMHYDLISGTDVPGSADQLAKIESSNYVQAIIIISDGRTNTGTEQAVNSFLDRVNNPDRKIHVFTVGVGDYRQPVEIKIDEIQSPQAIRPDEKFPLRVPILVSKQLRGEKLRPILEAVRVKDQQNKVLYPTWWSRRTAPVFTFPVKDGVATGDGEWPSFTADYEIDLINLVLQQITGNTDAADLKRRELEYMKDALDRLGVEKVKSDAIKSVFMERFLEGEWEFTARVKPHEQEEFDGDWHMSQPPARVTVQNKKLKILLFAGGPTRDYQFTRTLLAREAQAKRIELSVYLQSGARLEGVDQDVPADRLLKHFPHRRGPESDPNDKFSSINSYDLIIAFDPDWSALNLNLPESAGKIENKQQCKLLKNWVSREGGGIIFVAGPVNTYMLAQGGHDLDELPLMVPVVLKDYRLEPDIRVDMQTKYPLTFTQVALTVDFLKLETGPKVDSPIAGWDLFFWGSAGRPLTPGEEPKNGFFSYYPVKSKRNDTMVLATFSGPPETKINNQTEEQPFIATMRDGSGKTVYIGSSEMWRLRQYKESYHETFWLNMCRFATSGSTSRAKFGRFVAATKAMAGQIGIEVQIKEAISMKGEEEGQAEVLMPGDPLPKKSAFVPKLYIRKVGSDKDIGEPVTLTPKQYDGPWQGWWEAKVKIKEEGDYEIVNKIFAPKEKNPLTSETLVHRIRVDEPKLEEANLREDFDQLKILATDAEGIADRMKGDLDDLLPPKSKFSTEGRKLFFPLAKADRIPECLYKLDPRRVRTGIGIKDDWDFGGSVKTIFVVWGAPLFLFIFAGAMMMTHGKWISGSISMLLAFVVPLMLTVLVPVLGAVTGWYTCDWGVVRLHFAYVLAAAVFFFGLEWLTRKLLKLA